MRLSDAIALGSTLLKRGEYIANDESVGCVLQMALMAIGKSRSRVACTEAGFEWLWLIRRSERVCPACERIVAQANELIAIHLNDMHGWPTEKIADYVRSIEPPEPSAQQTPAVHCELCEVGRV